MKNVCIFSSCYVSRTIHLLLLWAFVSCSRVNFTFTFTSPSLTKIVLQKYTFWIATEYEAVYGLDRSRIDYLYGQDFPHNLESTSIL